MKRREIILLIVATLAFATTSYSGEKHELTITKPPASIAKWYKPQSKQQLWRFTMFRLGRSMQAIGEYTAYEDKERLQQWVTQFAKDYKSIGEKVPEWADDLELKWLKRLQQAAAKGEFDKIGRIQRKIGQSCAGCHKEYRAVTAALYRGMNFNEVTVEDGETMEERKFKEAMQRLGSALNSMMIANQDHRFDAAEGAYKQFRSRLDDIANSCSACHQSGKQRDYLIGANREKLDQIGKAIKTKDPEKVQHAVGGVGGPICGTCHSIHRTFAELRNFIDK